MVLAWHSRSDPMAARRIEYVAPRFFQDNWGVVALTIVTARTGLTKKTDVKSAAATLCIIFLRGRCELVVVVVIIVGGDGSAGFGAKSTLFRRQLDTVGVTLLL